MNIPDVGTRATFTSQLTGTVTDHIKSVAGEVTAVEVDSEHWVAITGDYDTTWEVTPYPAVSVGDVIGVHGTDLTVPPLTVLIDKDGDAWKSGYDKPSFFWMADDDENRDPQTLRDLLDFAPLAVVWVPA